MKNQHNRRSVLVLALAGFALAALSGCNTVGGTAADLGLAGAGGVAGYHLSDHKAGGAAAGAVVGYAASRIAQSQVKREISEAEQRGYDRAMNQSVKQHYWIIQRGEMGSGFVGVRARLPGFLRHAHAPASEFPVLGRQFSLEAFRPDRPTAGHAFKMLPFARRLILYQPFGPSRRGLAGLPLIFRTVAEG